MNISHVSLIPVPLQKKLTKLHCKGNCRFNDVLLPVCNQTWKYLGRT